MRINKSVIIQCVFFLATITMLAVPPGYSWWYGDTSATGNPIINGVEVPLPVEPTCDELENFVNARSGAVQTALGNFDNTVPGEPALSIHYPDEAWEGNTLLSCAGQGCRIASDSDPDAEILWGALLINMDGEFVHGWLKEDMNGIPAKLLPGGRVMGGQGGGFGGSHIVMLNWNGNKLWEWEAIGRGWHHDFNIGDSPTGYYCPGQLPKHSRDRVVITNRRIYFSEGYTQHISKWDLIDEVLCIVDKKGNIKWTWEAWAHFEQMGFTDEGVEGVYGEKGKPRGGGAGATGTDWCHFNQIGTLGDNPHYRAGNLRFHPKNIIVDSRSSSMIAIIAYAAGSDSKGEWDEGDIVWKVDPDSISYPFGQIIGPHTAHLIPYGLPGAGNIVVFDNGGRSDFGSLGEDFGGNACPGTWPSALRDYSRFIEFDPISFEIIQLYENNQGHVNSYGNWERKFFSSFISSVQRLPNGNTLICEGNQARVFEITPENKIVWEYNAISEPGGPGVIGRALYRAYRYPVSWVDDDD